MKRVIIESPFKGDNAYQQERNKRYSLECMKDSMRRGEAPFLSHLIYTQVLNEQKEEERKFGIELGFVWGQCADLTAVYTDNGISEGMKLGIENSIASGRPIEYRQLPQVQDLIDVVHKNDLQFLLEKISMHFNISLFDMKSKIRDRPIVDARHVYFTVARELFPTKSLKVIGSIVNKDHTTVMHGITEVRKVREKQGKYAGFINSSEILLCLRNQNA